MNNYYDPKFVERLFDNMSASYDRMNYITSFGFSELWRKQAVDSLHMQKGKVTVDLMTGMGECWKHILRKSDESSKLIALDFSTEMIRQADRNKAKFKNARIETLKENVFENSISRESADYIVSGFGLKTFNEQQLDLLAGEIERILKTGGRFCLVDVSVPNAFILKRLYLFYLKRVIPVLGKLFLGNPETYRMLGVYTEAFKNARQVAEIFKRYHFEVQYVEYFYGCASGIIGTKTTA